MTSLLFRSRARARRLVPLVLLALLTPAGCATTWATGHPAPSSVVAGAAPQVSGEPAGSLLVSPVAYDVGGVVEASFTTPVQGQPSILQRKEGSSWTQVAAGTQDANGRVSFTVPFDAKATYRAVTPATGAAAATESASADAQWKSTLRDDFSAKSLDTKTWSGHNDGLYYGPRLCAASYPDMRSVTDGKLVMLTAPATPAREAKARAKAPCKYGVYDGSIVSTEKSYEFQYGIVAARVKFSPDPGQHAAVWLQSYDPNGGEIDILESFGYKRGIQNKTHRVLPDGTIASDGGYIPNNTPKTDRAWWDEYHVVSVEWTKDSYVFRVDGVETMRTTKGISQAKDFLMISWGSSDWELPRMDASKLPSTTSVDWVGVWQEK
jgi:beta-glucanase (GH16 family)